MKLEEGMYVRYEGLINKILEIDEDYIVFDMNWYDHWAEEVSSMKIDRFVNDYKPITNRNIGELLEAGDFLDFHCIEKIEGTTIFLTDGWFIDFDDVEDLVGTICTKEQFKQCSYEVSK